MNILLDTHALLWWLRDSRRLGKQARAWIRSDETLVWISAAAIWEISIKAALGRLTVAASFEEQLRAEMERSGFRSLPVSFEHALSVRNLPPLHADPIDRMLIAQAQCEDLTLMTADSAIAAYQVRVVDAST
jgi:PIN domain nuclease of toxin-antitoxin system